MSLDLEYNVTFEVIDSWEQLRRIKDYEKVGGAILFQSLFEKCPPTKVLFGFPINMNPRDEKVFKSKRFLTHATYMIQMLDKALNMLGPDVDLLMEILKDLGKKHVRFGVKAEYFPMMGEALFDMLRDTLKDDFTPELQESWTQVYDGLSGEIIKAMNSERAVLLSWGKLKELENYEEEAGAVLFQSLFAKCPESKTLFGFPLDMDPHSDAMRTSRRFRMHAAYFIQMLDKALNLLEAKQLEENMASLGKMHDQFGVKEEYFPFMGEALFEMMEKLLKDDWNAETREAWSEIYEKMSAQMIQAMDHAKR